MPASLHLVTIREREYGRFNIYMIMVGSVVFAACKLSMKSMVYVQHGRVQTVKEIHYFSELSLIFNIIGTISL